MEGARQLRLLLWRDYLIRKRNFISLAGVLWATGIMIGVYTVRINIDNQDFPTCQFPARALPSAGILPFLQSFICSVNNECSPMDQYEEIPSYNNSKLSRLRDKLAPLVDSSVLELAASAPPAARLLATLARAADEPAFIHFTENGLKVEDLFKRAAPVKRYVTSHLQLDDDVATSLMTSQIGFQGMVNGKLDRCSVEAMSQTLLLANSEHLQVVVDRLCALSKQDVNKMFMHLLYEINFSKYIKMLGDMYFKMSGDDRISKLGEFVTAVLRMSRLQHFLPPEAVAMFYGRTADFSYLHLDLIQKFVELFEPTFGETEQYKTIREFADTAVIAIQYLSKIFGNLSNNTDDEQASTSASAGASGVQLDMSIEKINKVLDNAAVVSAKGETIDPYDVLTKIINMIVKFLPTNYKHDVLFYSTLLSKLMESAQSVIDTNMHIEEIAYNVTLRNPDAIKLLKGLSTETTVKIFEALVSAERTQILTSDLSAPGQVFCDVNKLQQFLVVSGTEAAAVSQQLCSHGWAQYAADLVTSLGVFRLKNNINEMASLLIQETLGKDTSSQLYSVEKDFQILRNFTRALITMDSERPPGRDWRQLLDIGDDHELMKVVRDKPHLGKLMLISVHGALAKEIVKQNTILQYKINPVLLDINTFITALNEQLEATPSYVSEGIKEVYGDVVKTVLMTANDGEKTYKALSTYSEDILCNGGDNAAMYLNFPSGVDTERLAVILCNASIAIENGLKNDSIVSKAIAKINETTHTIFSEVNWTELVSNIQNLYVKLDSDYPYLFEFSTYSMDQVTQEEVQKMCDKAKEYWFGIKNLQRGLRLSISLVFRLLDLLDHGTFSLSSETWLKMKFVTTNAIGPLTVIDDTVKLVTALLTNSTHTSRLPPITVQAVSVIVPNLPQLIVDAVNIVIHDYTDIEPIIALVNGSPPWPCSGSLSELLELSSPAQEAVLALETLLCASSDLQDEWRHYLHDRRIRIDKTLTWNTTQYSPQLYLQMSSTFNSLVDDTGLVRAACQYIVDDEAAEGRLSLLRAWNYAAVMANSTQANEMFRRFLSKFDSVLGSVDTRAVNTSVSLNSLWEGYVRCVGAGAGAGADCGGEGRALWASALRVTSLVFEGIVTDLTTYFTEVNGPEYNILQLVGFTKSTALYALYARLPEYAAVLVNSYWDYEFMSRVRQASLTSFWDCEAVVSALVPAPGSSIQTADITRVKPYLCPSFIYWLSLPRDDNVLFNVVAKTQYYFYSFQAKDANSSFETAFSKGVALRNFLTSISKQNNTSATNELTLDTIKDKLANFIDKILNYRLKATDESYKLFSETNKKQFMSSVYLTRIVAIVNKLATAITDLTIDDNFVANENISQDDVTKLTADLKIMKNVFKRKSEDAIAIHYDLLTNLLWKNDDNYTIVDAMDDMCRDLKENTSKVIVVGEVRTKTQICAKNYRVLYGAVHNTVVNDYEDARQSLLNMINILRSSDDGNFTDVFEFLNNRTQLVDSIKHSIKFSYDLGLPIYLKYLQSNLQGYKVLLTFLSGGRWWEELRVLYAGPEATKFFGYVEQGFEVADHFLNNLDGIHLVRLVRELKSNESSSFCRASLSLSDFLPDGTGALSALKQQICALDKVELFRELPPLRFASQGYESSLQISKEVDYTALNTDISNIESNIGLISEGPKEPLRPSWITEDKLHQFRNNVMNLVSKETLTKITFGVLSNGVDAGTLFLNNSECTSCSQMTSWFKQLNLQLFKKQEYDGLLCRLNAMSLDDVYLTLKNDFHWDMFVRELISSRNYTTYELNKSMAEFVGLVEVHLLDDMRAHPTRLADCLARDVPRNELGNATLIIQTLAHIAKLLRAETPHLHKVEGVKDLPYLKALYKDVAHKLNVYLPLKTYLKQGADLKNELLLRRIVTDDEVALDIVEADINLREANNGVEDLGELIRLGTNNWEHICADHDCGDIFTIITDNLNKTKIGIDLPALQSAEYWQFSFVSSILVHVEGVLAATARLAAAAGALDVRELAAGRLAAVLDAPLILTMDDNVDTILYSLEGLTSELHPLLQGSPLEADLRALQAGLRILHQFRTYLLHEADLKLKVSTYFPDPEAVESALSALGINNTNFWSVAAPRIHAGYLQLRPILSPKDRNFHMRSVVCDIDWFLRVVSPAQLGVVSAEEVAAAVLDQFCALADDVAKDTVSALMANANFTTVIDKVKEHVLLKLYAASGVSPAQGAAVLQRLPRMAALLPTLQHSAAGLTQDLLHEPLFRNLREFSSVGELVSSSDFLANAGNMVCGTPFRTGVSRILGNVIKSQDNAAGPTHAQLDVLPTEFCRSMYKQIVGMDGGKIVWSFVKPLIMGKILYTPPVPAVTEIIQKANASFADMIAMTDLVHSLAGALPPLEALAAHGAGAAALQRLLTAPATSALAAQLLGGTHIDLDFDVERLLAGLGDVKSIGKLISKASDLLHCINLDRFVAASDESALMHRAAQLTAINEFTAGIVFLNEDALANDLTNVEYKIRMDIENVPTTARIHAYQWVPGPESSFVENMRYFRGFLQIQDMVDRAVIQLAAERRPAARARRASPGGGDSGGKEAGVVDWAVYTQQEPYPCYRKDYFQSSLQESQALLVAFFFGLLFTVTSAVRFLVHDYESGNTMMMSVMGVDLKYHSLSWLCVSLAELVVTQACVTAVLSGGGILPRTDPTLLFAILLLYALSVLSFCYLVSRVFSSASFAAVCAGVGYLLTFMPFILILSLEAVLHMFYKMLVCLWMSSALCYALLQLATLEAAGRGARWPDVLPAADGTLPAALAMLAFDAALYLFLACLIDKYYGIKTLRSNIYTSQKDKAGVSIVNVSKTYSPGGRRAKVALDNVSMELQQGQITTLLGHNGAGKTTLTKILCGMVRPTSGHVVVRGGGARVGACAQRDVLVESLTPREHIALYAQVAQALTPHELNEEVDRMVEVMSLGAVGGQAVCRLSGGTRRRVCVALAFVGRPALVALDEPTAGVDPAARRDIWDMIVKLKADRTILLTTHHLDEAEILSDQIVIMHKGQVHTTGSPLEIRRTLGSGYKLSVELPVREEPCARHERAKSVVAAVRDVVRNACVTDLSDPLEVTLPFYDADGASNDFVGLCTALERQQTTLGFSSYSLDCSSLEQVFCDICLKADSAQEYTVGVEPSKEGPSGSSSSSSVTEGGALVAAGGPRRGARGDQLRALLRARALHFTRDRLLMFMLIALPTLFVSVAMGFSLLRPPPDNERSLPLTPHLYRASTQYLLSNPSIYSDNVDPAFAQRVMSLLQNNKKTKTWNEQDSPKCKCLETRQECEIFSNMTDARPEMMILPDADTLNSWITDSFDIYVEKRYGGYSSALKNNKTNLIAWYNNKGYHATPAFLNNLNNAIFRAVVGDSANITTYSHPLKISEEQLSKDTIYQHIADAGICALVLVAYSAAAAGGAVPLVAARARQEKRLQLLAAVSPAAYWAGALLWDLTIIAVNMTLTALVMLAFGFPVFVERSNLPAICILIMLFGYACGALVHVAEKLFQSASLANMLLFCGNAFLGLSGITVLLILDIISDSDATDNARWFLHKIFLLSPQFALGDGMLEIAKNTIQAQVLYRFGMDTYKDPLSSDLISLHVCYLLAVGTGLMLLNLAIEYGYFDALATRWHGYGDVAPDAGAGPEPADVAAERRRVLASLADTHDRPLSLSTLGNINRGFVHTEGSKNSLQRSVCTARDVMQCVRVRRVRGGTLAVHDLTLGLAPGQCVALLGENGAGKSTTFAMLTGEIRPTRGHIYLDGKKRDARGLCRGLISYCPQSDAVDPLLSVRETLQLYCRLRGITDEDDVIERTINMFDLSKYVDVRSGLLSGGNRRKLCTALAFMCRAPLVLLDEPTSGMDPVSRACVWRGCAGAARAGRGVLLSTHALADARRAAARVALLSTGRLLALASLSACSARFGGGYVVQCVCGDAAAAWRGVARRVPGATLAVRHPHALHVHIPTHTTVDGKEVVTRLSDIFRAMSELQVACDIEDYTVNKSSLEQMFLSLSKKNREDEVAIEPIPSPDRTRVDSELDSVTSL